MGGKAVWIIVATDDDTCEWTNSDGWVDRGCGDEFTATERNELRLPIGGRWKRLRKAR